MSTPILATKLYIPAPRPHLVHRQRLIERLNGGLHRKLTLISAPAGYGKTTLVSSWIFDLQREATSQKEIQNPKSKIQNQIAWLSLDEGDNDPTRFLTYMVAALQTLAPNLGGGVLALLQSPQPPTMEITLTALLNEIATVPDQIVLILDDYHLIDAGGGVPSGTGAVDQALTFLIEHLPPQMHLVITTREDPQLPLARLRARGELSEIRAADLRFTLAEATDFLNQMMELNLAAEQIAALETHTEGWIAGLQLAALALQGTLSMQGQQDTGSFIKSFTGSHRFVLDYLIEEVLQQQPEQIQTFLLRTSILNRLCAPLCDALLGDPATPGQTTLEYLERANLLLVPLDSQRQWYRYHHLFADVLQARLQKEQPDLVAKLHRQASVWWEQHNFRAEAIHHALAAEDFPRAADLLELERSVTLGTYFRSASWLAWVMALPNELVRSRPKLTIGLVWELLFSGKLEAAEAWMQETDRLLRLAAPIDELAEAKTTPKVVLNEGDLRLLQVSLAIARAFHAQALGNAGDTVKHVHQALTLIPDGDDYIHGLANSLLGLASFKTGDLARSHSHMASGIAHLRRAGNLLFATSGIYILADIRVAQGRLMDAITTYEEAIQLLMTQGDSMRQGAAELYLGLSEIYLEQGKMEAATQHLRRSEELGKQVALPEWPFPLYLAQARLKEIQGDLVGAFALLDQAEQIYQRTPIPDVRPIAALKARVWIRQGNLMEALDWVQRRKLTVTDDLSYLHEFEHITLARALIANYQRDQSAYTIQQAVELLDRLLKAAEAGGRFGSVIEILVLQALAHKAQGNIPLALASLERALTLAEPEGYLRVFVDEGTPLAPLLSAVAAHGVATVYIGKLLAAFPNVVAKPMPTPQSTPHSRSTEAYDRPQSDLIEPLSQREREVLQLIAQGLSNQEICQRLFLALDTVKGHNRRIFDKLQVQRRTEAVARARALGLL